MGERTILGIDPGHKEGTGYVLASVSESGQEMQIHAAATEWDAPGFRPSTPEENEWVREQAKWIDHLRSVLPPIGLSALPPLQAPPASEFIMPIANVRQTRRRARMARKKRRGWA